MEQSIKTALTLHVEKFHTLYETRRYATMVTESIVLPNTVTDLSLPISPL